MCSPLPKGAPTALHSKSPDTALSAAADVWVAQGCPVPSLVHHFPVLLLYEAFSKDQLMPATRLMGTGLSRSRHPLRKGTACSVGDFRLLCPTKNSHTPRGNQSAAMGFKGFGKHLACLLYFCHLRDLWETAFGGCTPGGVG